MQPQQIPALGVCRYFDIDGIAGKDQGAAFIGHLHIESYRGQHCVDICKEILQGGVIRSVVSGYGDRGNQASVLEGNHQGDVPGEEKICRWVRGGVGLVRFSRRDHGRDPRFAAIDNGQTQLVNVCRGGLDLEMACSFQADHTAVVNHL